MSLILPQSTLDLLDLLERVPLIRRHPGLQLDKFSIPGDQTIQKRAIENVICANDMLVNTNAEFQQLRQRWLSNTQSGAATVSLLRCTTTSPLTLHLSRASALENAGICLHPLYGFVYLPGSGLKGMSRAFAETVWLPTQTDAKTAWRKIEDVFGWAPNPERKQQIRDPNHPAAKRFRVEDDPHSAEIKAHVGEIVFHDAWPESWPKLIVDIVNNHHSDYYQHADNQHAPGDWENPWPVYFLAVTPGVTFTFPLAKRRNDVPDELLSLASEWLLGSLCHLGAGAKTNAGYGAFNPTDNEQTATVASVASTWENATKPSRHRAEFSTTLELVTPAFLAGANQQAEDCDLRPATLRGHLRWWWRTMHAGFLDVQTLRALEAAIWGDTKSGGAVRIELSPKQPGRIRLYNHPQERQSGTRYLAYGMDEKSKGHRKQRFCLDPPATWQLRIFARPTKFDDKLVTASCVLMQAKAALWLICNQGGVGSKSRKGFGSLSAAVKDFSELKDCHDVAKQLRANCGIPHAFAPELAQSPSISDPERENPQIDIATASVDDAIERVGRAYSAVASRFKHNVDQTGTVRLANKAAWGLPRKIHGPQKDGPNRRRDGTLVQNPETWQAPKWLDFPKRPPNVTPSNTRHASPIHIHISKTSVGEFGVRVLAMPAAHLTSRDESIKMLKAFVAAFISELETTAAIGGLGRTPGSPSSPSRPATIGKRSFGTPTTVKFLGPRTGKPGFRVLEPGKPEGILNQGAVPTILPRVEADIQVFIHDDARPPQYRWDKPEPKTKSKPKGGRGG